MAGSATAAASRADRAAAPAEDDVNEVRRPPLPPGARPEAGRRTTVDTIDCGTTRKDVRQAVTSWATGDVVQVHGALHRRFWRGPGGLAGRYEIEVRQVERLRRAAAP